MTIVLTFTDALEMSDVVTALVLATTDTITLSDHLGLDHQVGPEYPKLPYNTTACALLPDASQQFCDPRASGTEYQQNSEKETRFILRYNVDMSTATEALGTQRASVLPHSAPSLAMTQASPANLQDLLVAIKTKFPKSNLAMLQVTAKKIAQFKGLPMEQVPLQVLSTLGAAFKLDLQSRRYKAKTVRTYSHYANVLLAHATELGILLPHLELSAEWQRVRLAMAKVAGSANVIRYAISIGRTPNDFSLQDLRNWVDLMQRQGRSYNYVDSERSRFRRAMAHCGFQQNLCDVFQSRPGYGIPWAELPAGLRAEIEALAEWKQARFAAGRRRGSRLRPVSAKKLSGFIGQLYGFAITVQKHAGIDSLSALVTSERVTAFVAWYLNERQRKTNPLRSNLGLLCAAVKQYPGFQGRDFSWFDELMRSLEEDETEAGERKQRKQRQSVAYDSLAEVPNRIRKIRETGEHSAKRTALLVRDELLVRWWLALPWRQRNIRECRVTGENANIFKGELPISVPIRKPEWVEEALRRNPREQFWQMRFSTEETKTKNDLHAIVPLELVPLLELYLNHFRETLIEGSDPGTLFLDNAGDAFTDKGLVRLLEDITFRHAGKAVNPHLVRDIFAYKWLDDHPEDYLTLSMILWHRDIKTTLRTYGGNFNESNGICRVDEWLRRRSSREAAS